MRAISLARLLPVPKITVTTCKLRCYGPRAKPPMTHKTDITVDKLVDMIKTGELSLPEMQRGYVWKADRVRDLLDSLYRGYPSGAILVWDTDRGVPNRDLAISQGENPFQGRKLLLDGQQRLTSLSSILRGEPVQVHGKQKTIDILFNLDHPEGPPTEEPQDSDVDDGESDIDDDDDDDDAPTTPTPQDRLRNLAFAKASQALLSSSTWIRVADIFSDKPDSEILARALPGGWNDPNFKKYSERLQRVRKIRDYSYVMQVLDRTMEYEEVAEIFVRVNSRGVKLRSSDLALAQITSRWRDSLRLFEGFQTRCQEKGFFLDVGQIVRALVVFATGQSRFKTVGTLSQQKLESVWPKTQANILWALGYLKSLRIDTTAMLSSPFLIIALAYYHEFHPSLTGDEGRTLRRWLLYANARGHFSRGSTETILDSDLALIRAGRGPMDLLELLQRQVGRLEFTARDLVGSSPKSPILPVIFLALRERGALDLQSGVALTSPDVSRSRLDNWHFVFPDSQLGSAHAERSERKELANIVFLNSVKRGKKSNGPANRWIAKARESFGDKALAAHRLPTDLEVYQAANFRAFLDYRRQALADLLKDFIDGAETGELTTEHIASWIRGGETDSVEFKQRAIDDNGQVLDYVSKEVASFLNTNGGAVLLGVDDDGKLVGIDPDIERLKKPSADNYQKVIIDHLIQRLGKVHVPAIKVSLPRVEGINLCVIQVERGASSAYVTGPNKQPIFWIRAANQCQALVGKEIEDYVSQR